MGVRVAVETKVCSREWCGLWPTGHRFRYRVIITQNDCASGGKHLGKQWCPNALYAEGKFSDCYIPLSLGELALPFLSTFVESIVLDVRLLR